MKKKIEYSNNIFWRQDTSWTATLKDVYCQVETKTLFKSQLQWQN